MTSVYCCVAYPQKSRALENNVIDDYVGSPLTIKTPKITATVWPSGLTFGYISKESEIHASTAHFSCVHRNMIHKRQATGLVPVSVGNGEIENLGQVWVAEYYPALKKTVMPPWQQTKLDLEAVVLCELCQAQEDQSAWLLPCMNLKESLTKAVSRIESSGWGGAW